MFHVLKRIGIFCTLLLTATLSACNLFQEEFDAEPVTYVPIYMKEPIKTLETAERFDMEVPIRCNVNWKDQKLSSVEPFERSEFTLIRYDGGDSLPEMRVKNFKLDKEPIDEVFKILLENTGINVISKEGPYTKISPNLEGKLADVAEMIADYGDLYTVYDAKIKRLTLTRKAKWMLHIPASKEVMLAVLDAVRGLGLENIVVDWEDKTARFEADRFTERKVRHLIRQFNEDSVLVAFDVSVYRITPKGKELNWMEILEAFKDGTVKTSLPGIIGRLMVLDPSLNNTNLRKFLAERGEVHLISEGNFALPNRWQGRFDIGLCTRDDLLETDLQLLAEPKFSDRQNDEERSRFETKIILRTSRGEMTNFTVNSRLNENYVVMGVPTRYFEASMPNFVPNNVELVLFISPRIIRLVDSY